ncbi:acyl-CoA dehydrogenase C-terminal domain-containing protein [Caenimonas soli]|uniref:acyl-CoA dehydrogenase C-terminal domain-containing protein n=1 Tax=Caenimonas soli TaxID=2735555 RepID=UPI0015580A25|nr:acyl-CoA dehydrogenase C-terminal domain-containing protein [Caenimonas soli]NPC59325.1 acyl-CoA dehydrogenase [Caenimonas soli]
MPHYAPPLPEFQFLLQEVFDYEATVTALPGLQDATMDIVLAALEAAGAFSKNLLLPINLDGDHEGCAMAHGKVFTPSGYKQAYGDFREGGWPSLAGDPNYGGQGLPLSLALFVREFIASGSMAFGMYGGLSQGAYRAISAHGSDFLKSLFLPRLIDGSWTGTMCLTEPESGSDLSQLRTRAVPEADGTYRLTGAKIFISGGDHDLADNIVHLVLGRLPDAPPGTRGISLFVVPKLWPAAGQDSASLTDNGVICSSIEHKMGIRASATAALNFEGARGWLLGEPHGGLRAMFTMMNSSRVGVAVQSVGVAELSLQNARSYALERRQGRAPQPAGAKPIGGTSDPIIMHPDVRKNLLTMKALVEGCRALYVEQAMALDVRARHADAAAQERADSDLALMTPVLKSFISDCAVETTRLGIVIYGGHGYVHENGMEQLLRDASIVPLYEGTNGIQAIDLVTRKIPADGGRAVNDFLERVLMSINALRGRSELAAVCAKLGESLIHLQQATLFMQDRVKSDPVTAAAGASDYLRMFGLVACGHAWLRIAAAALRARGGQSPTFYKGKLAAARFFMNHLLPDTGRLACTIREGAASIVDLQPEEL